MRYEIEILDGLAEGKESANHQNLSLKQVKEFLSKIGENTQENTNTILHLKEWESALFGTYLVTRCGEEKSFSFENQEDFSISKEKVIEQMTIAFWEAMEENERSFQEFLSTNPPPFERSSALREYHNSRRSNEIKYMQLISSLEESNPMTELISSFMSLNEDET